MKKTAMIILGASGNLAQIKLLPALSMLYAQGELDSSVRVIGSGRKDFSHDFFRDKVDCCDDFKKIMYYHRGIEGLKRYVKSFGNFDNVIIFFSLPPHVYKDTVQALYEEGFRDEVKLVLEKPFGYDYESARSLNEYISGYFNEKQIYRIDHYLAKEAVQNILAFRFANLIFEPVWNHRYVESIQVNAVEDIGIGRRADYFESAGMIRDLIQNHLVQLLSLMTMEPPVTFSARDIRAQKLNIMKCLNVKRYRKLQADSYKNEPGVSPESRTETFAEMEFEIENMRWAGVPIYVHAGKYLDRKGTEIAVRFKSLPHILFNKESELSRNQIIFKIQPSEGIVLDLASKTPGTDFSISDTNMKFCYREHFKQKISEAYIKLLLDAVRGDKTLFLSAGESEITWKKFEKCLSDNRLDGTYPEGSPPPLSLNTDPVDFTKYKTYC